jgi:hypothetical protein
VGKQAQCQVAVELVVSDGEIAEISWMRRGFHFFSPLA